MYSDYDPCNRCSGTDIISDTAAGDLICRNCGEIQASRMIDNSAEWREYGEEDDRGSSGSAARSSGQVDRFGSSSTFFTGGLSDAARAALAKTQIQTTDKRELKMMKIAEIVSDIGSKLNITRRILNCAYDLCKRAVMENTSPAKRNELVATAVVSIACRLEGSARSLQEISLASGLDPHAINKVQSMLARELNIDIGRVSSGSLIARIVCNPLVGLRDPVMIQYAKDICHIVSEEGVLDGQPQQATAAAAIIFSSSVCSLVKNNDTLHNNKRDRNGGQLNNLKNKVNVTKTIEIALATQLSVKKAYIALCLYAEIITPNELKDKLSKQQSYDKNGRVIHWSKLIPTYDELCKVFD